MSLLVLPVMLLAIHAIVRAEERFLAERFGTQYEEYTRQVNRFFPSLRGLAATMSSYLIREIEGNPRITVRPRTVVTDGGGEGRLEWLTLRDLDSTANDATQQVNVQYRLGTTAAWTNVTNGYVADATVANASGPDIPLSVTLPLAANNQSQVQVRIMTTNATGTLSSTGSTVNFTNAAADRKTHV